MMKQLLTFDKRVALMSVPAVNMTRLFCRAQTTPPTSNGAKESTDTFVLPGDHMVGKRDVAIDNYVPLLTDQIHARINFKIFGFTDRPVKFGIWMDKSGLITRMEIQQPSGNAAFDNSVKALAQARMPSSSSQCTDLDNRYDRCAGSTMKNSATHSSSARARIRPHHHSNFSRAGSRER